MNKWHLQKRIYHSEERERQREPNRDKNEFLCFELDWDGREV